MCPNKDFEKIPIEWQSTGNPEFPYHAFVDGERWVIRLNDWPDDPSFYTLLVGSEVVMDVPAWPDAWKRPT
jgi:hypothetical protein